MPFGNVSYEHLRNRAARRDGLEPGAGGSLTTDLASGLTEHLNAAAKAAWLYYPWAETVQVDSVSPGGGSGRYLNPATSLATTGLYWEEVLAVLRDDPETTANPRKVAYRVLSDGYYILGDNIPDPAYVVWREGPPEFTAVAHDSTATYDTGEVVYQPTTGHCYRSVEDANAGDPPASGWTTVWLPSRLATAVVLLTHAGMRREDGEDRGAALIEAQADALLDQEIVRETEREGQTVYASGATYGQS